MNVISLFSGCGALRGIEDARGQLFFDYIRILKEFRPRFFLSEEAGYDVSLTMVNAKNYGVAEEPETCFLHRIQKRSAHRFRISEGLNRRRREEADIAEHHLGSAGNRSSCRTEKLPQSGSNQQQRVFHRRVFSDFHEPQQGKGLGRTGLYSAGIRSAVI